MGSEKEKAASEPSLQAQNLASMHDGLLQLAAVERDQRATILDLTALCTAHPENRIAERNLALERIGHRFTTTIGTDFFRWLAEHHERNG